MERTQRVILEIVWDDDDVNPPSSWDWATLLDLTCTEDVRVVAADQSHVGRPGEWQ